MKQGWNIAALQFLTELEDATTGGTCSVPGGPITLYGTCYATLAKFYLGANEPLRERTRDFIVECQDAVTGLMIGPELRDFSARPGAVHDREHLLFHLTCAAVPVCRHFGMALSHPQRTAQEFCDLDFLRSWLDRRNLKQAWFEGNNLLFVGQLLVDLRDADKNPHAQRALDFWFQWLDEHIDPATSLWGTNGFCSAMEAVYGGYHQLLVYYSEHHPIANPQGLIDTVLALQHTDGGFNPRGNGGACEDVDCVDILVNLYKRTDYRRAEVRSALRQCLRHLLSIQNADGGFPYNRGEEQSHMGIPGTQAAPNQSTVFATWFRVHTLALMAEILTDEPALSFPFRFTNNLSMGWHQPWKKAEHPLTEEDKSSEAEFDRQWDRRRQYQLISNRFSPIKRIASRAWGKTRRTLRSFSDKSS